jgi:hypothetical protein
VRPENSEALEEGNGLRFLAGFVGALPLAFGHETIGVEDRRSALPLAHMAAESERLTERQPALAGEAVLDHSAPKNENIDSGIAPSGRSVLGQRERRLRRGRPPWLDPWKRTCLELGDDLGGDVVIKAGAVGTEASAGAVSGHGRISTTGAGGLSSG